MIFEGASEVLLTFRRAYIDLYSSGQNGRKWSPYGLAPPSDTDRGARRVNPSSWSFIMDSKIGDDDVTNEDLIEAAADLDPQPEYVVPKDYLHDPERTSESVREFMDLYEESSLTSEVIIPLQPTSAGSPENPDMKSPNYDHSDHYDTLKDEFVGVSTWGLGGVKEADTSIQMNAAKAFRKHVREFPRGPRLHMFGAGASVEFVRTIRQNPRLIQSADCATITRQLISGRMVDKYLDYSDDDFSLPHGNNSTTVLGQFIQAGLTMLAYLLGPDLDDDDLDDLLEPEDDRVQVGLENW